MKTCAARSRFLGLAHVLIGKPVSTLPGHALMAKPSLTLGTAAAMPSAERAGADIHLALRGISHTYPARAAQGPVPALSSLDLEFRCGEFVGVVGPSGCGKSPLLEIIAGLVTPTSGTIEMEGRDITGT